MKRFQFFSIVITIVLLMSACTPQPLDPYISSAVPQQENTQNTEVSVELTTAPRITFESISAQEAKALMDQNPDAIVLDVRTQMEFDEGYIEGALLLPHTDIQAKASEVLPDKDALILVYCRSGNRSVLASRDLVEMGYTQIKEFGGIINWPFEILKP